MTSSQERIQVLYEISLSIGATGELSETARRALSAYLRKLNCSAGAVFERRDARDGQATYETVAMIPSRAAISDGFKSALERLPRDGDDEAFLSSLPITDRTDGGVSYYIMALPDFGVLVLVTRQRQLGSETVAALRPLNEKLATACRGERYEDRLREERDRFETIFATIDEPLVSVCPDDGRLTVQRVNPAFEITFGVGEAAALDRPLGTLLGPPPTADDELPSLGAASVTAKLRRETADGMAEFLFRSTPFSAADERSEHLVLLVDVTEAADRQRQLERFHEVTKALSRILRHNIRNDLTVIQAMAERIRDSTDGEPARDAVKILRTSEQLASTAEKAREMRELVATENEASGVSLEAAITDAVDAVRREYPDAEFGIDIDVPEGTTTVPSIGIAVRHLVENGIEHHDATAHGTIDEYAAHPPRVDVTVRADGDSPTIEVRDNGPGIPETEVAVLERGSETPLEHGTGAGLWIVGQIIDYCDASLEFSRDDGTTATITLDR